MAVIILARHKNSRGETVSYTVAVDGYTVNYRIEDLIKDIGNKVDNAYLVNNKEYRAKKGYTIRTVVDNTALKVQTMSKPANTIKNTLPNDFYGKDFINICRRIRKYANLGRIVVSKEKHKSNGGRNTDLFDIIELCNISIDDFITGYLSVLQPYSLEHFQKGNEKSKSIWLVEFGYAVKLVIKIDEKNSEKPIVVSFHESRIQGKNGVSQQSGIKDFSDKPCAIFVNDCSKIYDSYSVSTIMQTGFVRYNINLNALTCNNDVALVRYSDIKKKKNEILDELFDRVTKLYMNNTSMPIIRFENKELYISFSGKGCATINQLIMIIDMYSAYTDSNSTRILSEVATNIIEEVAIQDRKYILKALINKYDKNPRNKMALLIYKELDR